MKKLALILTVGAASLWAAGTYAESQTLISVNFEGGDTVGLASTDSTGAPGYVGANWNNETDSTGASLTLNDSSDTTSPIVLAYADTSPFGVNGPDTDNSTPQRTLFGGSLQVNFGDADVTLDGLSAFSSYDIVAYYNGGDSFPGSRTAQISLTDGTDSQTYYVSNIDTVFTDFTQSDSTDPSNSAEGNYVVFSGIQGSASDEQILSMHDSNNNLGLVGFQIYGTLADSNPSVPEPSTWALLAGGLGLLIGYAKIRQRGAAHFGSV